MSRDDSEQDDHEEDLKEETIFPSDRLFNPKIYEGDPLHCPSGFDAVTIRLSGEAEANLNWEKEKAIAYKAIEKGFLIYWDLSLGLFSQLKHPLFHPSQFQSIAFAIEHFLSTLYTELAPYSLGISLYRGTCDFTKQISRWLDSDVQQTTNFHTIRESIPNASDEAIRSIFCANAAVEYLTLISAKIPDSLPVALFLDVSEPPKEISLLQLLNPEKFKRFHLFLKNAPIPFDTPGWECFGRRGQSTAQKTPFDTLATETTVGVCIPSLACQEMKPYFDLETVIRYWHHQSLPLKLIAESTLTAHWDGLRDIIFHPQGMSAQGKRMLKGFAAAGGQLVTVAHQSLFGEEIFWRDWLPSQ